MEFELGVLNPIKIEDLKNVFKKEISSEVEVAFLESEPVVNTKQEEQDVYFLYRQQVVEFGIISKEKRYLDAITEGLDQAMQQHANLILMGQDIAEYGGAFKITEGFMQKFGKERVENTPIYESAVVETALGLSINGFKSVVEMQFADFVTVALNQIINNLAKSHYRWGEKADVVVRMPVGAGTGAGLSILKAKKLGLPRLPD